MITCNWTVSAMECLSDLEAEHGYVTTVHWSCDGTDGTYSGRVYATQSFAVNPEKPDFVPFDQLTEAEVISWVQGAIGAEGVTATEASVQSQITNQAFPKIVMPPFPWIN